MTRRDALVRVIDALHAEISALKANDVSGLERATSGKLKAIETLQQLGDGPATPELHGLAEEADRLVQQQAIMLATDKMFMITIVIFCLAAASIWIAPRPTRAPGMGGGDH